MQELRSMPGFQIWQDLTDLDVSAYTLDGNYTDLRRFIVFMSSEEAAKHLLPVRNREKLNAVQLNVARLLHNFVAAALSLVDHTRIVHDKLNVGTRSSPIMKNVRSAIS